MTMQPTHMYIAHENQWREQHMKTNVVKKI